MTSMTNMHLVPQKMFTIDVFKVAQSQYDHVQYIAEQ